MKRINNLTLVIFALVAAFVSACGGGSELSVDELVASGDLEAIRAKKKELDAQYQAIEADITKLDEAIGLNTEDRNLPW